MGIITIFALHPTFLFIVASLQVEYTRHQLVTHTIFVPLLYLTMLPLLMFVGEVVFAGSTSGHHACRATATTIDKQQH
jgi:hypothetical protein